MQKKGVLAFNNVHDREYRVCMFQLEMKAFLTLDSEVVKRSWPILLCTVWAEST